MCSQTLFVCSNGNGGWVVGLDKWRQDMAGRSGILDTHWHGMRLCYDAGAKRTRIWLREPLDGQQAWSAGVLGLSKAHHGRLLVMIPLTGWGIGYDERARYLH